MSKFKHYVYRGDETIVFTDTNGISRYLKPGEEVVLLYGITFQLKDFSGVRFNIEKQVLKRCFERRWDDEELERYERIREKAVIAAMQSLIANLKDVPVSPDMHEVELVPKNAIWFADRLVEELKTNEE